MNSFVLNFSDVDKTSAGIVGGKGANLGELSKLDGIQVPDGFCVTTEAFKQIIATSGRVNTLLGQLSSLQAEDRDKISELSAAIRREIEEIGIPDEIGNDISRRLRELGENNAYAIRSSATMEDSPAASFAGQHDTYLNIAGKDAILKHISKCWASLYTERAIVYRKLNGFDNGSVYLAVVVQKMVFAEVAGILFTADPVSGNRKVLSIDAAFGPGEAVVSGHVSPDSYKVRDDRIIRKNLAAKNSGAATLADHQILTLARIGRRIEKHFGSPQDIEWCYSDNSFYIVQSRPVTTLYPVPETTGAENHVFISVGHQQMMTDAMKPLGLSIWQLSAARPMHIAGGRLFVDVTRELASPSRDILLDVFGKSDPLIKDALTNIIGRNDFIKPAAPDGIAATSDQAPPPSRFHILHDYDPAIVSQLIKEREASIEQLKKDIIEKSGVELIDFIADDISQFKKILADPQSFGVIMTAMNAASWINDKMYEWLGEKNAADTISQSVSNNITSAMGLALLEVADVIRPFTGVIAYLQQTKDDNFLDELDKLKGGKEAAHTIRHFLKHYGMRCAGEIDITKPRWSEKPIDILPAILSNIRNFQPGERERRFEQGKKEALEKETELLQKLKQLPEGEQKARETKRMIALVRNFAGYREYPKYSIVSRYFIYKQALLKEAEQLMEMSVIDKKEDVYFLTLGEIREVIRSKKLDRGIITKRKNEFKQYEKLTPPRVMTSEGEIITGEYKRENIPAGALTGLPVSSGVIEGRARVILNMADADLGEEDILVTPFTDPSWTPLFLSIKGLVTEVGGLMTHGSVIAREYGLPAVVGVENATKIIKDGQRIRVNGTDGYVAFI